jgi:hypothetical protein
MTLCVVTLERYASFKTSARNTSTARPAENPARSPLRWQTYAGPALSAGEVGVPQLCDRWFGLSLITKRLHYARLQSSAHRPAPSWSSAGEPFLISRQNPARTSRYHASTASHPAAKLAPIVRGHRLQDLHHMRPHRSRTDLIRCPRRCRPVEKMYPTRS